MEIIKENDGVGSGIDADLFGGKQPSEYVLIGQAAKIDENGNLTVIGDVTVEGVVSFNEQEPDYFPNKKSCLFVRESGPDYLSNDPFIKGLILWYTMDEIQDNTVFDLVNSKNDALTHNGVSVSEISVLGKALHFDKTKQQYITKAHADNVDFKTNNFTIIFWMKVPQPENWTVVLSKANEWGSQDHYYGWLFGNSGALANSKGLEFLINSGGTGDKNEKSAKTPTDFDVFDNKWHFVAGVREGTQIRLYVDGGDPKGTADNVTQSVTTDNPVMFGTVNNQYEYYTGCIDELAIWNRALTQSEITELFNNKKGKRITTVTSNLYWADNKGNVQPVTKHYGHKGLDAIIRSEKVGIGTENPEAKLDVAGTHY